jgi:hypothetical protein
MRKLSAEGTFSELIDLSPGTTSYEDTTATTSDTCEYYIESFNAFGSTQSDTQSIQLDRIDDISFTDTALAQGVSDHATAWGPYRSFVITDPKTRTNRKPDKSVLRQPVSIGP